MIFYYTIMYTEDKKEVDSNVDWREEFQFKDLEEEEKNKGQQFILIFTYFSYYYDLILFCFNNFNGIIN